MRSALFLLYKRQPISEDKKENPIEIPMEDKKQVEKEIRELAGIIEEDLQLF